MNNPTRIAVVVFMTGLALAAYNGYEERNNPDVGPCIHQIETSAVIGPVTDEEGQRIERFTVVNLSRQERVEGPGGNESPITRSCTGSCEIDLPGPGNYSAVISSEGYEPETVENETSQISFEGGCPSKEVNKLRLTASLRRSE